VLQKTLRLPAATGSVRVDWAGAASLTAAASLLLVWVTFAGDGYAWLSWQSDGRTATLAGVLTLPLVLGLALGRFTADGLAESGVRAGGGGSSLSRPAELPAPVRAVIEDAYGHATGDLFVYTVPLAPVAFVCVLFIREVPLRTSNAVGDDFEDGSR
jgi:hypothetical protein